MSPWVARGTRGVDVPKAESSTRRDLDQLEDQATRHHVLHDKKQHHQGLHLEPSDPRHGNGQGEQQPCPSGHHPGGVLGTGPVCSLQITKKSSQPSKTELRLEWGQQLIPSARCWGGHVSIPHLVLGP